MEFLSFLRGIEAAVPDWLDVRSVMDNLETHRTGKVRNRLARRWHRHVHFTPTSTSWLNRVERRFAELPGKRLQRGAHRPVAEFKADIMSFIDAHNEMPKPCRWVKPADGVLVSVRRFRLKMNEPGAIEDV